MASELHLIEPWLQGSEEEAWIEDGFRKLEELLAKWARFEELYG